MELRVMPWDRHSCGKKNVEEKPFPVYLNFPVVINKFLFYSKCCRKKKYMGSHVNVDGPYRHIAHKFSLKFK